MIGFSQRPVLLSPTETRTSAIIAQTVTELPWVITDLISQYAFEDFSKAQRPIIFDERYQLAVCDENIETMAAIKAALSSSSCDPDIKRRIFENYSQSLGGHYSQQLNSIFVEIRTSGGQINLDCVNFSGLILHNLNLSHASMVAAKFVNSALDSVQLIGADLTGTLIKSGIVKNTDLTSTLLCKSVIENIEFDHVDMSDADLTGAAFFQSTFKYVIAQGLISDDTVLNEVIRLSAFNLEKETVDSELNRFLINYSETHPKTKSVNVAILAGQYSSDDASAMFRMYTGS